MWGGMWGRMWGRMLGPMWGQFHSSVYFVLLFDLMYLRSMVSVIIPTVITPPSSVWVNGTCVSGDQCMSMSIGLDWFRAFFTNIKITTHASKGMCHLHFSRCPPARITSPEWYISGGKKLGCIQEKQRMFVSWQIDRSHLQPVNWTTMLASTTFMHANTPQTRNEKDKVNIGNFLKRLA